ncbi:hypothetical protein CCACVL1_00316, partial [Corchorus capsularis]
MARSSTRIHICVYGLRRHLSCGGSGDWRTIWLQFYGARYNPA